MARIPQDELERLKRDTDLVELVSAAGVKLEKKGADFVGLCPMHDDKEPSLVVTPSKNLWNCLGACGAGGTVIDWVMKSQGVSFRYAVEILRNGETPTSVKNVKRTAAPLLPCPITKDATGPKLIAQLLAFYHQELLKSTAALGYLQERGINNPEVINHFKLGFCNRVLYYRLPTVHSNDGRAMRQHLADAGFVRDSGIEHFTGYVVIPVHDARGDAVEIYGRRITRKIDPRNPQHLYLPGPHRGVFNLDALRQSKEIILCESFIDALTFWCAGYHNVTSSFGANGFIDELFEAFMACGVKRVLIAYDRDDAGEKAAGKLAEKLGNEGLSCFRVKFPHGMDANEYAQKVKPARQSLGVLLRSAEYMAGPLKTLNFAPACAAAPAAELIANRQMEAEKAASSLAAADQPPRPVKTQVEAQSCGPAAAAPMAIELTEASPVPPPPAADVAAEISDHEIIIVLADRRWRVRGLARNLSYEHLRINLLVSSGDHFHVDALDLYSARQRNVFLKQATEELQIKLEILKRDLGRVLVKLEELQDQQIKNQLEPKSAVIQLNDEDRNAALKLLKDEKLLDRITDDLSTCGLVGEQTNKLVAYLAAVSRKLSKPLAVMVQSSSAAGKSALMDAVLAFCPDEERVQYSAMTGQSLFYMGESDLKHKILAIAEEEGAEKASYALKLLQSEGKLSIASTGKDPKSGRLVTHEYHVEGPAAILLTTTAIDLDEELLNRCVVLAVDESREQTRAIHKMQREERTLEGLERRLARRDLQTLHQNAQRLLRPLHVVNPYADKLTFLDDTTRTRRDHMKYLCLIDAIALVCQHQREVKTGVVRGKRVDYIEATLSDITMANRLASEALGRTLDELPPQTRRLLFLVAEMVQSICEEQKIDQRDLRFTRRQVRQYTAFGNTQLKIHLNRLTEMEYLLVHRGVRGQSYTYELLYGGEGKNGSRFVLGLLDAEGKKAVADTKWSGQKPEWSAPGRPLVGGRSGGGRSAQDSDITQDNHEISVNPQKSTYTGNRENRGVVVAAASYMPGE